MVDIGSLALVIAFAASIYAIVAFIFGSKGGYPKLITSAKFSVLAVFGLVSIAVAALAYALATHDFEIEYVASYTSQDMPLLYLISALWAGNAGSLLFWGWLVSLFAAVLMLQKLSNGKTLLPYASVVIMMTVTFLLALLLFISDPFSKLANIPADGIGLYPILGNLGMLLHPPLLLAGYAAFTIPFAFAMAALVTKRLDYKEWIVAIKKWTLVAWLLLSISIMTGAWWTYTELGWGGYWTWSSVENANLMPWLIATAFLHSIIIQKRNGMFKIWNIALIIITFVLVIFSAFLARSGILSSLSTPAKSSLGPFFLVFIGLICLCSLVLLIYRRRELKDKAEVEAIVSRAGTFLLNNLLLAGATLVILVGTIVSVMSKTAIGSAATVGESFFNRVSMPIFLAIILLTGVCVLIGWSKPSIKRLGRRTLWPAAAALFVIIILVVLGAREWYALVAFLACGFVLFATIFEWAREISVRRRTRAENYLKTFFGLIRSNRSRYGGYIVHISIAVIAVGIIGSSVYSAEEEAALAPGDSMTVGNYTLVYEGLDYQPTLDKMAFTANVSIYNQGKFIGVLTPQKYFHTSFSQAVDEAAIRSTLTDDLYLILVGWDVNGTTHLRASVNPLVVWIWIGGWSFLLGGLIAFWPDRQR